MTSSTTNAEPKSGIPIVLTITRIVAGPAIAGIVLWASSLTHIDPPLAGLLYGLTAILFVLATATDWLDGWLARKLNAVTPLGAALDHAADKVLITSVVVALAYAALPMTLIIAAVLILGRDVAVAGLREGISAQGRSLPVSSLGKWKAAAEMAGVTAFLAFQTSALLYAPSVLVSGLDWGARIMFWIAAGLALVSGAGYFAAAFKRN